MTAPAEVVRALRDALARSQVERQRAERTGAIAQRHERSMPIDEPAMGGFHQRMATMHRQVQRMHLAAAAMHASHAERLRAVVETPQMHLPLPQFMASVATTARAEAAAVALFGPGLVETLAVASDHTARAAQDLEFTLGEGPGRDAMDTRQPVWVTGTALYRRWSQYGPAVGRLGVDSIAATAVELGGVPLGSLVVYGPHGPATDDAADHLRTVAQAVAVMLVSDEGASWAQIDLDRSPLLAEADHRAVVHQAAGIVSVQHGCPIADALALVRARAFADDRSIESLATDIVAHRLRLT
jgi:hypothetical protein